MWNVGGALGGALAFTQLSSGTAWTEMAESFAVSLLFSVCISALCFAVLPRLGSRLHRLPGPGYWALMTSAMLVLAVLGSSIALALLSAVGYVNSDAIARTFRSSLRFTIIITLAVGISVTMLQTLRGRLERATLALRTKERDEAEARRLAAEAHLSSLEARVQPHFLFNTLNSIAALIPQDPVGAERMTGQLASLLRSSLDAGGSPLTSLGQELQNVRDYLDIEQVRFGSRLRYEIRVDLDEERARVPRFALQTLVENSVKYAVAPRREGGTIVVSARDAAASLELEVADDGPGFGDEAVPGEGHGLSLVRDRLRMTFGEDARLVVDSRPGSTRAIIHLPRT